MRVVVRWAHNRGTLLAVLLLVACVVLAIRFAGPGITSPSSDSYSPQPWLAVADEQTQLIGASAADSAAWAYARLPATAPPARVNGVELEYAPGNTGQQLAFLRHTEATGWQVVETPRGAGGEALGDLVPIPTSARVTESGGGALVARSGSQPVLLVRHPGDRYTETPVDASVLLPAGGGEPAETIADLDGQRAPTAAFEHTGNTAVLVAAVGREREAVLFNDGTTWLREEIDVPSGGGTGVKVQAIAATGPENAWLLARTDSVPGRGVVLYKRVPDGGGHKWEEQPLGEPVFEDRDTPAEGVSNVQVMTGNTSPLTVTTDGVWVDGSLRSDGVTNDFTLYRRTTDGSAVSWCDATDGGAAICDRELGFSFGKNIGYRSVAWSGAGFGRRVVSNPYDPAGAASTNRGTYARLLGDTFVRMPGAGVANKPTLALQSDDRGWLGGPVELTGQPAPSRFATWPVSLRTPLLAAASEPGKQVGALETSAVAVGTGGSVARYTPGAGWVPEYLLTENGLVARPTLRGVAWAEAGRAHAVGDQGAMWLWRGETQLWERDPGIPVGLDENLMDVGFQPGDSSRGYAIGRNGMILRYEKSWERDPLPAGVDPEVDLFKIAFAGKQALVAAGNDILVNDGAEWKVDAEARALIQSRGAQILAVAGLPDGTAFAAGAGGMVLERPGPNASWRTADQPLVGVTVTAAALFREGGTARAVVTVIPKLLYPPPEQVPDPDPNVPAPLLPIVPAPSDGYVLRQTADGWRDEQRNAFGGVTLDKPVKADPVLALLIGPTGEGWAIGGWNGRIDSVGRGADDATQRQRVQTSRIARYEQQTPEAPAGAQAAAIAPTTGTVNFMVGAHAKCERRCAELSLLSIGPDRTLTSALNSASKFRNEPNGPRFFVYAGGRSNASSSTQPASEAFRYADLLAASGGIPVFPTVSAGDSSGGAADGYKAAFTNFQAPVGDSPAPAGFVPRGSGSGTRTHYAFDSDGPTGRVRVIVIDNSRGSLAASDPYQNPPEPQKPWLISELADAKASGIPAVVVGSRDLNDKISPKLNLASDGLEIARVLRDGGTSAYFFERTEENRAYPIPAGEPDSIPSFGTGTLGYRSEVSGSSTQPNTDFGDSGVLMAAVRVSERDPVTNRAPVTVRMIPVIEELSLQAIDGTLLRRSRPALFSGLGRRPVAGDRWGDGNGGSASPGGSSPYTAFPPDICRTVGCSTRILPEFTFTSSDPDIGDFVKQDPNSDNLRKPLLNSFNRPITDPTSGLFCAFNAGTTTVRVTAGGLTYSRTVTVQPGSVQPPCGTRPLDPSRFRPGGASASPPPPPPGGTPTSPPISLALPALPAVVAQAKPPAPRPYIEPPFLLGPETGIAPRAAAPPPPPSLARPIPPTGGMSRAMEKQREEEVATEDSQAFVAYQANQPANSTGTLAGLILAMAIAAAAIGSGRRGRPGSGPVPAATGAAVPIEDRFTTRPRQNRSARRPR